MLSLCSYKNESQLVRQLLKRNKKVLSSSIFWVDEMKWKIIIIISLFVCRATRTASERSKDTFRTRSESITCVTIVDETGDRRRWRWWWWLNLIWIEREKKQHITVVCSNIWVSFVVCLFVYLVERRVLGKRLKASDCTTENQRMHIFRALVSKFKLWQLFWKMKQKMKQNYVITVSRFDECRITWYSSTILFHLLIRISFENNVFFSYPLPPSISRASRATFNASIH